MLYFSLVYVIFFPEYLETFIQRSTRIRAKRWLHNCHLWGPDRSLLLPHHCHQIKLSTDGNGFNKSICFFQLQRLPHKGKDGFQMEFLFFPEHFQTFL